MDLASDKILEYIRERYNDLSKGHKKIADYILGNYDIAAYMTAAKLGEAAGVSESSVVRFATGIGFAGYPEFQSKLALFVSESLKRGSGKVKMADSLSGHIMELDVNTIQSTYEGIETEVMNQCVEMLTEAKRVYIIGLHESQMVASYLSYYLKYILPDVRLVTVNDANTMIEQIYKIDKDDVLVGISFPNYSYNVLKCMEYANLRQAQIIGITDKKNSPVVLYSSCNLYADTTQVGVLQSMTAPISLINILITKTCEANKIGTAENVRVIKEVCNDYQIIGNDEINVFDDNILRDIKKLGEN